MGSLDSHISLAIQQLHISGYICIYQYQAFKSGIRMFLAGLDKPMMRKQKVLL